MKQWYALYVSLYAYDDYSRKYIHPLQTKHDWAGTLFIAIINSAQKGRYFAVTFISNFPEVWLQTFAWQYVKYVQVMVYSK